MSLILDFKNNNEYVCVIRLFVTFHHAKYQEGKRVPIFLSETLVTPEWPYEGGHDVIMIL